MSIPPLIVKDLFALVVKIHEIQHFVKDATKKKVGILVSMTISRAFLYVCLAFIGGVAASSLVFTPLIFTSAVFILGLALITVFWAKDKRITAVGFCLLFFAAGIFRHQMFERPVDSIEYYHKGVAGAKPPQPPYILRVVREKLRQSTDTFLSPPQSALLLGIMLGDTSQFSKDFKEKMNRSGTRHITAVSGMNVTILAGMLVWVGVFFGLWRGQAFYFAVFAIILYIMMIGAPPSAIRAGIMGGIVLFAEKVGRLSQAQRLLIIAATVMLAFNPLLLKFDIGFELSFLATLGIAKLSPYFRERLAKIKAPDFLEFKSTLAMTLPAVIFTAPILAANFGQIALISIISNILIIPVIPFIFALGFLASFIGGVVEPLGTLAFGPVWLFLTYVHKVIEISAALPFAVMQVEAFPWYAAAAYFTLLWFGIRKFKLDIG